jgi:hypothetical protein
MEAELDKQQRNNALNAWMESNLTNYVKKQMGTADDPVRKLAEQDILHMKPYGTREAGSMVMRKRAGLGYPAQGVGQNETAKFWERMSDASIDSYPAGSYKHGALDESILANNPWLQNVPDETMINSGKGLARELGFDHIVDVLRGDLSSGRIRPEQLSKVSMEQAVRRTAEYDQEMARKMAEAQLKATEGMPTHKDYADKGYKWLELTKPKITVDTPLPEGFRWLEPKMGYERLEGPSLLDPQRTRTYLGNTKEQALKVAEERSMLGSEQTKMLQDALKYEGDTMGHCVGNYCEDVASGKSRIYSLRDAKGEPHVTIEVKPQKQNDPTKALKNDSAVPRELIDEYQKAFTESKKHSMHFASDFWPWLQQSNPEEYAKLTAELPPKIVQIKGKQNAAPKEDYLPFVQDFVRSGEWSDVGDFKNTGLIKHEGKYLTQSEYDDYLLNQLKPPAEGMAEGGGAFKKLEFMADGGKLVKGAAKIGKRLLADNSLPALEREANLQKFLSKSQVKDPVFHASKADVKKFSPKHRTGVSSMGHHFGTAEQANFRTGQYDFDSQTPNIGKYHLNIENPLEVSHMASFAPDHLAEQLMDMNLLKPETYDALSAKHNYDNIAIGDELVKVLRKNGYDGLKYANEREGEGFSYVPLNPTQIKSAIGNRGTYDIEDADITKANGGLAMAGGGKLVKGLGKIGKKLLADEAPKTTAPAVPRSVTAGDVVNGMLVRKDIPNTSSISASLYDYSTHGVQEVPMSAFETVGKPKYRSVQEEQYTKELARQIQENKELNPLIVVKDAKGHYILEGAHRFDALRELGIDSFPALMVHDLESLADVAAPIVKKADGGAAFKTLQFKDVQNFDGGGIAIPEMNNSFEGSSREPLLTEKDWANIKRNAPEVYEWAKQNVKDEASQLKTARGVKDFALRTGAQYLGGIPDLINLGLMGVDALADTSLSSEKPWFGSEQYIDALKRSGAVGENEFPIAETVAGVLAPAGLIKKGVKQLRKPRPKQEPKKRRGGLTAMSR